MQFPDSVSKLISLSLCISLQHPLQIQHSSFHNYHQNSYIITHTCTIFILLFSVIVLHVVAKLQLGFCWPDPKDSHYYCLRLFVCLSSTLLAPKSFSRF